MTLQRSIVLVGLMGAGKTSVGRKLADALAVQFVDSDDEVVAAAHMTIPEIFESYGEAEFRRLERAVIARLMRDDPVVLSTGGGAFIQPEIRDIVAESGVRVWLSADIDVLWSRVADKPGRPLLEAPNPYQTFCALADARNPIYATSDLTVQSSRQESQEDVAERVIASLKELDRRAGGNDIFLDRQRVQDG